MKNLGVKKRLGQADAVEYSVGMCWQVSFNDLKFKDPDWTSTPHLRLQYHITRVHRWKCLQLGKRCLSFCPGERGLVIMLLFEVHSFEYGRHPPLAFAGVSGLIRNQTDRDT